MLFSNLKLDTTGDVATLTLNRPDSLNALSSDLLMELTRAAELIGASDSRSVVVSGLGRAFCAGVDIDMLASLDDNGADSKDAYTRFLLGSTMADAIETIPQITVVALHGFVIGGGIVLAAACDLRIAAENTVFSIPEIDLGIPLAWGGIERLVREIGPALTKELVTTGRRFTASEAKDAGFLNEVVAPADVDRRAHEIATTIAAKAQLSVRITKAHVAEVLRGDRTRDDALSALEALSDPESQAVRDAYLAKLETAP